MRRTNDEEQAEEEEQEEKEKDEEDREGRRRVKKTISKDGDRQMHIGTGKWQPKTT